jgi:NADH dehydrogenase FAD-containing subunit
MYSASDNQSVETFLPEENMVILENGRQIKYKWLVLAMGLKEDFDSIPGLEEAWSDIDHPVFSCKVNSIQLSFIVIKIIRTILNGVSMYKRLQDSITPTIVEMLISVSLLTR